MRSLTVSHYPQDYKITGVLIWDALTQTLQKWIQAQVVYLGSKGFNNLGMEKENTERKTEERWSHLSLWVTGVYSHYRSPRSPAHVEHMPQSSPRLSLASGKGAEVLYTNSH